MRIDTRSTEFWEPAVAALQGAPGLQGVILAKTESAAEARETMEAFEAFEALKNVPVVALIESGRGLQHVDEIAASGVAGLGFGTVGTGPADIQRQAEIALEYGFTGKFALHEQQIRPLHDSFETR